MAQHGQEPDFWHPDTVAYLWSLTEVETLRFLPMFLGHEGGFTKYWLEDVEVRWCDIPAGELPQSGGSSGDRMSALETLLLATRERFGDLLEMLATEVVRPVPDLDSIERAIRDVSYASGKLENLAGVVIAPSTLQRWALEMSKQSQRFEHVVVGPGEPCAARVYLGMDGTGVPVRKSKLNGCQCRVKNPKFPSRWIESANMSNRQRGSARMLTRTIDRWWHWVVSLRMIAVIQA